VASLGKAGIGREFKGALGAAGLWPLKPTRLEVLQLNVGKLCNQTCRHCHVDAAPDRREQMTRETMEECLAALDRHPFTTLDITGGAPELNPHFRWLVEQAAARPGLRLIDRCNLTVLATAPMQGLPEFLAAHQVELACSLPHYRAPFTDRQRGEGVHAASIEVLQRLNALGYGDGKSGLKLTLVTNPVGAFLPGDQAALEAEWKRELWRLYQVRFDALFCLTNMPISRYLAWLLESGNFAAYMERLVVSFNPLAAEGVMCRTMISVGWDGQVYDCDFNQMLELPVDARARHIRDFDPAALTARSVVVGRHCFGCTAGAGSSCGGATAS
jgi:radical SAM/Cys-rich protein